MTDPFLEVMAIADAYGMRFEFVDHDCTQTAADLAYGPHPRFVEYKEGHYTDDTQMTASNSELLLTGRASTGFSDDDFITSWLNAFRRDPRRGYSQYMFKTMSEAVDVADFRSRIDGKGVTSGGAMRAMPFGLLADVEIVKVLTRQQAAITHNTTAGINAALAVSLSAHFLHHAGPKKKMMDFVHLHLTPEWNSVASGYTDKPDNGLQIVTQALDVVMKSDTLSEVLLNGANYDRRTDTDTLCAVAMAVASRCPDVVNDLPQNLYETHATGPYGLEYLRNLDQALMQKFPRQQIYAVSLKPD